jgi:hypothetical protein
MSYSTFFLFSKERFFGCLLCVRFCPRDCDKPAKSVTTSSSLYFSATIRFLLLFAKKHTHQKGRKDFPVAQSSSFSLSSLIQAT